MDAFDEYPKQSFRNYDEIKKIMKFLEEASLNSDKK
jgi:hypothetical protein